MKHINFFKRRVCSLAILLAMFAFFCSSLHAQTTHYIDQSPVFITEGSGDHIITGTTTSNYVVIETGYNGTVTLKDLDIKLTDDTATIAPILVKGKDNCSNYTPVTKVNIVLDGDNKLHFYGMEAAALQVNQGAQINISAIRPADNASGKLFAKASPYDPGSRDEPGGGAAIGAPASDYAQGWAKLYTKNSDGTWSQFTEDLDNKSEFDDTYKTAGGNIIISSGTVTAYSGHGAGIGGGHLTWYDGVVIVTGGIVDARAGRHSAGLGSGCPTGFGVDHEVFAEKSAIIVLPPCQITAFGANIGYMPPFYPDSLIAEDALAGAGHITYLNDPSNPVVTIRTENDEKNAAIYLDLLETKGLKEVFNYVHPTFDLSHVWIGKTDDNGLMKVHGWFQDETTFFTDASSTESSTFGRPYMPVSTTTPKETPTTIVLPLFAADIRFTDYPSRPLVEGYSSAQADKNAFCLKVEYNDPGTFTNITYKLAQDPSDFRKLTFLGPDSILEIPTPTALTPGQVFYIVVPLADGKEIGSYSDVILISGTYNTLPMSGYIRRISDQIVVKDDTGKNEHIKVTANPAFFTEDYPTNETVDLTLNINHLGMEPDYDKTAVTAKYIITTEANYDSVANIPLYQWTDMVIPATEGADAVTTVSFTGKPADTYYIHWYVVSGLIMAHSESVTDSVRHQYGGFGKYEIIITKKVTYKGNTNDGGTVPMDAIKYLPGDSVTVLGNTGLLTKTDATFIGWSFGASAVVTTPADEPADLMKPDSKFEIVRDTTLYAVWAVDKNGPGGGSDSIPDYLQLSVVYNGNDHTGGAVPTDANAYNNGDDVTVKAHGNLVRADATFIGWSFGKYNLVTTKADEPSDLMAADDQFKLIADTTLYAVWAVDKNGPGGGSDSIPDYMQLNVVYNGNDHTGGAVPTDANAYNNGDDVTIKAHGNLVRTDATFIGWSFGKYNLVTTKADEPSDLMAAGDQFTITADTILYAVWAVDKNGPGGGSDSIPDYMQLTVAYDGNNFTSGTVPTDANAYNNGDDVTVMAHGNLVRTDATFIGWSFGQTNLITTKADEPSDLMAAGDQFTITTDTILYAVWAVDATGPGGGSDSIPDYLQLNVTYNGNDHTGGTVPTDANAYNNGDNVTVKAHGNLVRTDATFIGWSFGQTNLITTKADEPSDLMAANNQFTITTDTTLYAVWAIDSTGPGGGGDSIPDYMQLTVTYNGNNFTGGVVPTDANAYNNGDDVTVKAHGNLVRTDAMFIGWSFEKYKLITSKADEPSDLMAANDQFVITADTTLYAVWAVDATGPGGGSDSIPDYDQLAVTYDGNGHTGGAVPTDGYLYNNGDNVTIKAHGSLVRVDAMFIGWSFGQTNLVTAKADEPSDLMAANDQFIITNATTLYAVWAVDATGPGGGSDSIPDYDQLAVTYNGNGHTGGTVPADGSLYNNGDNVTVKAHGSLVRTDAMFIGWSFGQSNLVTAKADEPSDLMAANDLFTITAATTLYAVWAVDATGPGGGSDSIPDYDQIAVTYDGNGHTGGTVPTDGSLYNNGDNVTVKAHGNLVRTDAMFIGWSFGQSNLVTAKADEPSDLMAANDQFTITAATTLYAVWAVDATGPGGGSDSIPDYDQIAVTYDGNGHTGGTVPTDGSLYNAGDNVTVKAHGTLVRTDAAFIGWSFGQTDLITAKSDEPSDLMVANDQFVITNGTTLYAVWAIDVTGPGGGGDSIPDYDQLAVTYDGNGYNSGTVPTDGALYNIGDNVIVKAHGNLVRTDAMFIGWSFGQTDLITAKSDEPSDLMAANDQFVIMNATMLYAVWAIDKTGPGGGSDSIPDYDQFGVTYNGNNETSGSVVDNNRYNSGTDIALKDKGDLVKTKRIFLGWTRTVESDIDDWDDEKALINSGKLKQPGYEFAITVDETWNAVWAFDNDDNGVPDYKQATITYKSGAADGGSNFPKYQAVEKETWVPMTDMGVKVRGYVLIGWSTPNIMPIITTAAIESMVASMAGFSAVGDSLYVTDNITLQAVWARDSNNDGLPDYGGNIIKPSFRKGEATDNEALTGARVWTYGNTLYIDSDKAVRVNIYTLGGMLYKQMEAPEGLTSELMQRGMYIVEIDGSRHKVVVK